MNEEGERTKRIISVDHTHARRHKEQVRKEKYLSNQRREDLQKN